MTPNATYPSSLINDKPKLI